MLNSIFQKHHKYIFSFFLLIILMVFYWNMLKSNTYFTIDDIALIGPVQRISNFFARYWEIERIDIQPVRDMTFYLDSCILKLTKFFSFRYTSLLIHFYCVLFVIKHLLKKTDKIFAYLVGLLIAINPVYVLSISWISARKHLLATLFILAAYDVLSGEEKFSYKRLVFYFTFCVLSFYSQPIHLWFPLWALFYYLFKDRPFKFDKKIIALILGVIASIVAGLHNIIYYHSTKAPKAVNVTTNYSLDDISQMINAYSRYFFNTFVPTNLHVYYSGAAVQNLYGIVFLAFYIFTLFKVKKNSTRIFLLAPLGALSLVIVHKIGCYVSDTYSLLFTYLIISLAMIKLYQSTTKKIIIYPVLAILILFNGYLLKNRVKLFQSGLDIFKYDITNEFTASSFTNYVNNLIILNKNAEALSLFLKFSDVLGPEGITIPMSFMRNVSSMIYASQDIYPEIKLKLLSNKYLWCSSVPFHRSLILLEHGFYKESFTEAELAAQNSYPQDLLRHSIIANYYWQCYYFGKPECGAVIKGVIDYLQVAKDVKLTTQLKLSQDHVLKFMDKKNVQPISKKFYYYYDESLSEIKETLGIVENLCMNYYKNY